MARFPWNDPKNVCAEKFSDLPFILFISRNIANSELARFMSQEKNKTNIFMSRNTVIYELEKMATTKYYVYPWGSQKR